MDIAIYGYHDASVCIKQNDQYFIYEAERFWKKRYAVLTQFFPDHAPTDDQFYEFFTYIKNKHNITSIETCYFDQFYQSDFEKLKEIFDVQRFVFVDHHEAHAYNALSQCPFTDTYVITYDGYGFNSDGSASSYVVWKTENNQLVKIKDFQPYAHNSLGNCYLSMSVHIKQIKKHNSKLGLSYAGKLMGICSYGKVIEEWKPHFEKFFDGGRICDGEELAFNLNLGELTIDCLDGEVALNFAATTQWAFENKFFKNFNSLNIPPGSNISLSGGCALNIKVNQMLLENGYNVYIPPNSGDCGLPLGMLTKYNNDRNINITYAGYPILDPNYTDKSCSSTTVSNKDIANILYNKKQILGYIRDNSECGPRALGNRSILCYPNVPNLKDTLNSKVKFREWYRPFGAITKLENLHKYFTNACESPHMTFCPNIKPEFQMPAITHVDGTCRIQTITQQQHPEIYDILTHIENMGGIGILLNTSFNIKGNPILTTRKDAFDIIKTTKLDGFVHNNILYTHTPKITNPLQRLTQM